MMARSAAALCWLGIAAAQQVGTTVKEEHPAMLLMQCSEEWGCQAEPASIVMDGNWRWVHGATEYNSGNCYEAGVWDETMCPDPVTCTQNCAIDGIDQKSYEGTYGIAPTPGGVELKYVVRGSDGGANVGSRTYLMDTDETYKMFKLLNKEFSFTVDGSTLPCGVNGAVYFVEMQVDGGLGGGNAAGAKYGTGYCDAQCPHDVKFMNGEANILDWDPDTALGRYGHCCAEMDLWEANSEAAAYTPHPCSAPGVVQCEGKDCGDIAKGERYEGICDKDGCDYNTFRLGEPNFFGPGGIVDSTKPVTVVTQFITDDGTDTGVLSEIRRLYVQDGQVIKNSKAPILGDESGSDEVDSITDAFCSAQKKAFSDPDDFSRKGGLRSMGEALGRGMVLVMSIWDDAATRMAWLDAASPANRSRAMPGIARGPCPRSAGRPEDLHADNSGAFVRYTDLRYGDIGTTYSVGSAAAAPDAAGGSEEAFCCFAASDQNDACGTCQPSGRAGAGSWCSQSGAHCRACGGQGVWCGAEVEQVFMKKDTEGSHHVHGARSMQQGVVAGAFLFAAVPVALVAGVLALRRFGGAGPAPGNTEGPASASASARPHAVLYEQLMSSVPGQRTLVPETKTETEEAA
mmetsp:Transcript_92306/g.197782  ORF Transcript_92306/g.197782 Transcript_92306/m.197782 type:complete len:628 (-) Transcript_92306:23-1906(-)